MLHPCWLMLVFSSTGRLGYSYCRSSCARISVWLSPDLVLAAHLVHSESTVRVRILATDKPINQQQGKRNTGRAKDRQRRSFESAGVSQTKHSPRFSCIPPVLSSPFRSTNTEAILFPSRTISNQTVAIKHGEEVSRWHTNCEYLRVKVSSAKGRCNKVFYNKNKQLTEAKNLTNRPKLVGLELLFKVVHSFYSEF